MRNFLTIMALFLITYIPVYYASSSQLKKFLGLNFVACVVLVTLAGIYVPEIDWYFYVIAILFLATVRGRIDAVCRYVLLAAFVPQMIWQIGAAGHFFGAIDSAGVIALAAYVVARFDRTGMVGNTRRGWTPEDFLVLISFLIMAVGGVGFDKFNDSLRSWVQQFLLIVMPYILFRATCKTTAEYRTAIACFGIATVFLAVYAVFEARMSVDVFDIITKHLSGVYARNVDMRGGMMRASTTMSGPLELACFMTVGVFALVCSRDFFRNALGYYGCIGVTVLGLLATQSRGSLVAVFISAVVLSLALRKRGIAAVAAAVAAAAWPTLQVLAGISPGIASFMNGGAAPHQGPYYDYRNLLLERGLQVAGNHPWTGMRMTAVLDALADITQGEGIVDLVNVYLVILLISGFVGLLPFLGLTITSGVRGTVGFKRIADPALLRARGFTLAAFTAVLFQFSFVSFIERVPLTFVLCLAGIRLLVTKRQALRKAAREPARAPLPASTEALAAA